MMLLILSIYLLSALITLYHIIIISGILKSFLFFKLQNFYKVNIKDKMYFLIIITFVVGSLLNKNLASDAYCMIESEWASEELNEFMLKGFKERLEVLQDTVLGCQDPVILREIMCELSSKIREVALTSTIVEPFSGNELPEVPLANIITFKDMMIHFIIFILLSLFGYIYFTYPYVISPVIFYQKQILFLLQIIKQDPDNFIDFFSDFYTALADEDFF